jgi:beta-N-acetylhexosaminidase
LAASAAAQIGPARGVGCWLKEIRPTSEVLVMLTIRGLKSLTAARIWRLLLAACVATVACTPVVAKAPVKSPPSNATAVAELRARQAPIMTRDRILASDPERLERLGRHIVIGYHSPSSVRALVEKKAIAGVFLTDHNVRGRKVAAIRAEIDSWQAIRAAQHLPPLIIAADQEGGAVSRLSPPLARQPGLARVLANLKPGADVKSAVVDYARKQAGELKRIGVNLNFSPVVDLKIDPQRRSDGETQLRYRALSADPKFVSDAAGWYCETLAAEGIFCTLKHFPGLGRVTRDTHRHAGDIKAPVLELNGTDWVPFRALMNKSHVVTMLAHVRLRDVDPTTPASYSLPVIDGLIRTEWGHQGLIITDDFSMGAVTRSANGVGGAAVKALNAGSDLVLVSYSDRHLNAVYTALIEAERNGDIDQVKRAQSDRRLIGLPAAHAPLPASGAAGAAERP